MLRPLRVYEEKELVFYNFYNKIDTVHILIQQDNSFSSVQNLLKKFVYDLQISYPATVATVVRTGDKLAVHNNIKFNQRCKLCKVINNVFVLYYRLFKNKILGADSTF